MCDTCQAKKPERECMHWYTVVEYGKLGDRDLTGTKHYCCPSHIPTLTDRQGAEKYAPAQLVPVVGSDSVPFRRDAT